jgi:hypothetical protein
MNAGRRVGAIKRDLRGVELCFAFWSFPPASTWGRESYIWELSLFHETSALAP